MIWLIRYLRLCCMASSVKGLSLTFLSKLALSMVLVFLSRFSYLFSDVENFLTLSIARVILPWDFWPFQPSLVIPTCFIYLSSLNLTDGRSDSSVLSRVWNFLDRFTEEKGRCFSEIVYFGFMREEFCLEKPAEELQDRVFVPKAFLTKADGVLSLKFFKSRRNVSSPLSFRLRRLSFLESRRCCIWFNSSSFLSKRYFL